MMETNLTQHFIEPRFNFQPIDAVWVLTHSFVIFTIHIGLALLEAGLISQKNHATIALRTLVDLVAGGFSFWLFGFGFAYGKDPGTNSFIAFGDYFFDADVKDPAMGGKFVSFVFQLSFATTASTIVGGAMAERYSLGILRFVGSFIWRQCLYWTKFKLI